MSRLESMQRRISAQIDGINWAAQEISGLEGDVLELGLGNGRTYDHLREVLPGRRIFVVDRVLQPHPSCLPPEELFLLGEGLEVLPALARKGQQFALVHYDFGRGIKADDVAEGAEMSQWIAKIMLSGGLVMSQQPLIGFQTLRGPVTVDPDRYHFYRAG